MSAVAVTVVIFIDADDEDSAERGVSAALDNLVTSGGDIELYDTLSSRTCEPDEEATPP